MSDAAAPPAEPKKSFAALRHPQYRRYFIYTAMAMMADNIEHVISYWVLYQKFQSPTLGGIAVLTHWLPFLLFSVYSGALADRFDNRRIIQLAMLFFITASLGWAWLFITDSVEQWHAVVLLTIHGMAGVLWGPASQLLIHDIVGGKDLQSAVRLNATARQLGILMGPAVGGALMLIFGAAVGLLVNVLIYLPLILWMWKTPYGARKAGKPDDKPAAHAGASTSTPRAGGAFLGGMLLEARGLLQPNARTAIVLTILWCISIAAFAATDNYPLAAALMFAAGFLQLAFNAMAQTLVQVNAPPTVRGRMIGLYNMANNGLRAFSGITVGILGAAIGIHWSLALSALVLLMITIVLLAFSMRSSTGNS